MSSKGEFRQFHTAFWTSPYVEGLDPSEKLLYAYFIAGPMSNMEGVYRTTVRRVSFETGLEREAVTRIAKRFEEAGKAGLYFESDSTCWVVVSNATDHMTSSPTVRKHAQDLYASLPAEVHEYMKSIGYHYLGGAEVEGKEQPKAPKPASPEKADDVHEATGAPMNATRYQNLCARYGRAEVDSYIEKVWNYAAAKGKTYKDYAAAAANFMKNDNVKSKSRGREYVSEFGGGS
jgi:hypothetical protein